MRAGSSPPTRPGRRPGSRLEARPTRSSSRARSQPARATHYRRSNPHGAHVLIRRAMSRVEQYGPAHRDIDVDALVRLADAHATAFEQADREGRCLRSPPHARRHRLSHGQADGGGPCPGLGYHWCHGPDAEDRRGDRHEIRSDPSAVPAGPHHERAGGTRRRGDPRPGGRAGADSWCRPTTSTVPARRSRPCSGSTPSPRWRPSVPGLGRPRGQGGAAVPGASGRSDVRRQGPALRRPPVRLPGRGRTPGRRVAPSSGGVDLDDPDLEVRLEIVGQEAHCVLDSIPGPGGLPLGTGGRAVALFSGVRLARGGVDGHAPGTELISCSAIWVDAGRPTPPWRWPAR